MRRPWQIPRQNQQQQQQQSIAVDEESRISIENLKHEEEDRFFITGVAANPHQELLQVVVRFACLNKNAQSFSSSELCRSVVHGVEA
jgi:hypothetical protein